MSLPDATASAALSAEIINPVFFIWLDILGDPIRANTSGHDITPSGTGDADLDGFLYSGVAGDIVDVSSVHYASGGSDPVTIKLSGIPGLDNDILGTIANRDNWLLRDARLWRVIRNAANVQQGGFHAYYTGRIVNITHGSEEGGQILSATIENYLSVFSPASNRSYLDQERYDIGDLSAKASIAIANGNYTGKIAGAITRWADRFASRVEW